VTGDDPAYVPHPTGRRLGGLDHDQPQREDGDD
jgi:hypothetical protein